MYCRYPKDGSFVVSAVGHPDFLQVWRYTGLGQKVALGTCVRTRESTVAGLENAASEGVISHEMELSV